MKKLKIVTGVIAILLLSTMCALTYAYYIDKETVINTIYPADSKISIEEKFPPDDPPIYPPQYEREKVVQIRNLKDKSYVRCYIEVSDQSLVDNNALELFFSGSPNWVKEGEFWYYTKPLDTNEITDPLLESVHFYENVPKDSFDIIVYAESIQEDGFKDYKDAFSHFNK